MQELSRVEQDLATVETYLNNIERKAVEARQSEVNEVNEVDKLLEELFTIDARLTRFGKQLEAFKTPGKSTKVGQAEGAELDSKLTKLKKLLNGDLELIGDAVVGRYRKRNMALPTSLWLDKADEVQSHIDSLQPLFDDISKDLQQYTNYLKETNNDPDSSIDPSNFEQPMADLQSMSSFVDAFLQYFKVLNALRNLYERDIPSGEDLDYSRIIDETRELVTQTIANVHLTRGNYGNGNDESEDGTGSWDKAKIEELFNLLKAQEETLSRAHRSLPTGSVAEALSSISGKPRKLPNA
eukprot:GHVU01054181.1.p1 GENE.GHVU01054181.1~~GHVU01054181.1.p1  ORF type:complete len:297 (-),score=38.87 GHVU01054181.1:410-1300(-)